MARDYNKDAELALKLITQFGTDCSLRKNTASPTDPNKPWGEDSDVELGEPTKCVLLPLSNTEKSLYPELVTVRDVRKMLIESVTLSGEPKIADEILLNGEKWKIENVKQLKPATVTVLWTLIVSR